MRRLRGLAGAILVALAPGGIWADHSAEEAANAAAFRRFAEAYNAKAEGWFQAYHNEDYVWEGLGVWAPSGRRVAYPEMLEMIDAEARHFPDRRMAIRRLLADGDRVAVDYEWTGTAAPGAPGLPAGAVQRYRNLLFVVFRNGKMSQAAEFGVAASDPCPGDRARC